MNSKPKRLQVGDGDRISELPDEVVCYILSFLPIVDAVQTTILSTRWNKLWTCVLDLRFDDDEDIKQQPSPRWVRFADQQPRWIRFADRVLKLRNSPNVRKFSLHCKRLSDSNIDHNSIFNGWIGTAITNNVVELDLDLFAGYYPIQKFEYKIPQSLFMCKSLKVMKVTSNCISYVNAPPPSSSHCFPSLKFLHVTANNRGNTWMEKLFLSNYPLLEYLAIGGARGEEALTFNISTPELKTLRTSFSNENHIDQHEPYNFFINAPKLENLIVEKNELSNYFLENPNSLLKAELNTGLGMERKTPAYIDRMTAFLAKISSTKYLSILEDGALLPRFGPLLEPWFLPDAFHNLNRLVLRCGCFSWKLLTNFLSRSPNLEHLVTEFEQMRASKNTFNPPEFVPICLSLRLKTIFMWRFVGETGEMEVIKYLLKYSKVLNNISISTKASGDPLYIPLHRRPKEELYKEILMFQKGSKTCRVGIFL